MHKYIQIMAMDKPYYTIKRAGMIHFLNNLQKDIGKALTETDMTFPELFEEYETYHAEVETGRLLRAELIQDWIEPGSTVLDVGIGDGFISDYLIKKRDAKVTGVDVSNTACEKARKRGITTQIKDINYGLGLDPNNLYDYILLLEVLEHTLYPSRVLLDATHHTKKGVIVTIPNSAYIKWRIQMLKGYHPRQSFMHLHFWSIKDFELFCTTLDIRMIAFRTFLPRLTLKFRNLLAWQQCWLLLPANRKV
jgi:methionine biosynthesis protein MetW